METILMTPEDIAAELRIARSRVFVLLANGDIPSIKLGRSRRVTRAAVEAYVQKLAGDQGGDAA